ncbi:MarR family winged helix-turn-helix transcriptional regulator [Thiolinea disciformis]|uniref:MarR family winged helix-turn-helix transcriptional regulator n=1 Tax=Thiolinea disciformis TaxID=125614 RepID=UPI000475C250|nr:MarR family transcriptional regulator [Thiolinea disciformis]
MDDRQNIVHSDSVGWLINAAAIKVNGIMAAMLEPLNLTQGQFAIMKALAEGDNITQTEIGKVVAMPNYAITRQLDILEQRGLLVRQVDEFSRRSFRICLTAAGRDLSPQLFAITQIVNENFLSSLQPQEAEHLKKLLQNLVA